MHAVDLAGEHRMPASTPLLALLTALLIGSADFSSHYALRRVRALPGAFFSLSLQLLTLLIVLSILGRWDVGDWKGPALFGLIGILHPGAFAVFLLLAIGRLGPARAQTLKGTSPFFGVAMAILFLGERPNLPIYFGLFLVAGGVMYLTSESSGRIGWGKDLAFPLTAAFLAALGPNLAKVALRHLNNPPLAATCTGGVVAVCIFHTLWPGNPKGRFWLWTHSFKDAMLFLPMGVLGSLGQLTYYTALQSGSVAVVVPLVHASPFVGILLSRILIQAHEGVNFRLIVTALAVVLGAALITLGRA
jgi:uncharacterized membrane protein